MANDNRRMRKDLEEAHAEIERLKAALTKIASDEKNCADHCRRQASRALERAALAKEG